MINMRNLNMLNWRWSAVWISQVVNKNCKSNGYSEHLMCKLVISDALNLQTITTCQSLGWVDLWEERQMDGQPFLNIQYCHSGYPVLLIQEILTKRWQHNRCDSCWLLTNHRSFDLSLPKSEISLGRKASSSSHYRSMAEVRSLCVLCY